MLQDKYYRKEIPASMRASLRLTEGPIQPPALLFRLDGKA